MGALPGRFGPKGLLIETYPFTHDKFDALFRYAFVGHCSGDIEPRGHSLLQLKAMAHGPAAIMEEPAATMMKTCTSALMTGFRASFSSASYFLRICVARRQPRRTRQLGMKLNLQLGCYCC